MPTSIRTYKKYLNPSGDPVPLLSASIQHLVLIMYMPATPIPKNTRDIFTVVTCLGFFIFYDLLIYAHNSILVLQLRQFPGLTNRLEKRNSGGSFKLSKAGSCQVDPC
jgi:hypothetical protein